MFPLEFIYFFYYFLFIFLNLENHYLNSYPLNHFNLKFQSNLILVEFARA